MKHKITHILFVCTGNICRSPFAEGLFTKIVSEKGYQGLSAESAGLFALPGNAATSLAQQVAAEHGVDLSDHKAKLATEERVDRSDLILVMEKNHETSILSFFQKATDKVRLMRHFARFGSKTRGIADPYGFNYEAYRFCFLDIEDAVRGLVEFLFSKKGPFMDGN